MQTKTKKISLKDKLKFLMVKSIEENPSILENILGVPIKLKEFSGAWEDYGIFIKENKGYTFLTREYADPDKNGRGNMILVSSINLEDIIIANESFYIIKSAQCSGTAIYDKRDLDIPLHNSIDAGLKEGFAPYDLLLTRAGIPKIRRVN